jgi:hypothetical protein
LTPEVFGAYTNGRPAPDRIGTWKELSMVVSERMGSRQRLEAVIAGQSADRTPVWGGWIACPDHICALAGVDLGAYWKDPVGVSVEAYRELGSDGLIGVFVPRGKNDYRCVDEQTFQRADKGLSLDETVRQIREMPSPEEIEKSFDLDAEYARFRAELLTMQDRCGEMLWAPAQWSAGAKVTWYADFGYENYFCIVGLYPDLAAKLMAIGGAYGWCRARLVARAVEEGIYPRACFFGEDICTQRGPMISPEFLREHYAPALRHGLQPLLDVGCKPVWHCDGDVRLLLQMLLDCGIQGFQGFQGECGMTLERISSLRTSEGEKLLIYGPLAVTTELPVCSPAEIYAKTRHAIDVCRDSAHLVLFTSNTINPDVPLENIRAMHEAARA